MTQSMWGGKETKYFYELSPDRILEAFERSTGLRSTGRVYELNSMENRVYEIEIELDEMPTNPAQRFRIAKFYRPNRWTKQQILEEHQFLVDLVQEEIPVVAPLVLSDGQTLNTLDAAEIYYTVFPKVQGRAPDELFEEQFPQIGRLLARLHQVGSMRKAKYRLPLTPQTYGIDNLRFLIDNKILPSELQTRYIKTVEAICTVSAPWFAATPTQRIHGDCHLGNLLWGTQGPFWVDFDDMVVGPCVQDIWLLALGDDEEAQWHRNLLLEGYEDLRHFDRSSLRLIEPLRALRFIHFSAWIARRWEDPAFPRAFPHFGGAHYWQGQLADLEDQLRMITEEVS